MKIFSNILVATALLSLAACTDSSKTESSAQGIGTTPANFSTPGTTQQAGATADLNPAHGQPGHRCDIPVGTPLSTPASSATPAPAGVTPTPVTTPATSNAVAGTNPAHGLPGHDCSIAVGAPLNK